MNDQQLMATIEQKYAAAIDAAAAGTPFPAALLAALTANESGGDPAAARFEPTVYSSLSLVMTGRKANFGSIGAADLKTFLGDVIKPETVVLGMMNLATSWGLTQIMGYQAVGGGYALAELSDPAKHYRRAVQILEGFRNTFKLDVAAGADAVSYEPFFRCWNSGSPDGKTFDPNYSGNGVLRMRLYEQLTEETSHDG